MKKIIFSFLILATLLITACIDCETKLYTKDGKCCTYACNLYCENGYEEGTCNCECKSDINVDDINIDDIFDDGQNVEPPVLPN